MALAYLSIGRTSALYKMGNIVISRLAKDLIVNDS